MARLCIDFARELHVRLFSTFASLGFDDVAWLTDDDLCWAIERGRIELADAEKSLAEKKSAKFQKGFESGQQFPEAQITRAEERVAQVRAKIAPFETELQKRESAGGANVQDE